MKRFLVAILYICGLGAVDLAWAQESEPAEVARIVGSQKVKQMDKQIKSLSKRINEGLNSGTLTREKANELKADVKAIWDKKQEFMTETGAKQITNVQLEKLKAMWKETAQKIHQAKHPGGKNPETTSADTK